MDRRLGWEGIMGIGGGVVSKESQKNLEKAEQLCRKKKPKLAVPYVLKAIEDDHNLDAIIQFAFLFDRPSAVEILEAAELKGRALLKRTLGNDCFDDDGDCVGHFWGMLETRPYMRVQQALVRLYFESKRYDMSANVIIDLLRLCPGDNLGQRSWLGSVLNHLGRYADALHFSQVWLGEEVTREGTSPPRGGTAFESPTRDVMSATREKSLSEWGSGAMLYSAAFAAFKLFGDCETSRQYLRIAARVNPNVLLKILARVQQPASLNMEARSINGPEEAQDYLWLTQDLWMEDAVWNWADNNPDVKNAVLKFCSRERCGVRETRVAEYKRCAACHLVSYCSRECQKDDWPNHKPDCIAHKQRKEFMKAMRTGKPLPKDYGTPI
ncbi:hypothetical protein B0H34DRAFT_719357 [Crassisporium funariophilum]|nr:hypothetical protein B0H34DRAFT_719357 [Crassisporium funariophilum]